MNVTIEATIYIDNKKVKSIYRNVGYGGTKEQVLTGVLNDFKTNLSAVLDDEPVFKTLADVTVEKTIPNVMTVVKSDKKE
jgi:hypothetical protein